MKHASSTLLCLLLVGGCVASPPPFTGEEGEMTGNFGDEVSAVLFVEPSGVKNDYEEFTTALKAIGRSGPGKRALYSRYVPVIGANGVLAGIEELWPKCHSEGHDLGKVIFAETRDVGVSLRVCRDGCYSGCMHGVLMEAFAGARTGAELDPEQHVDAELVKTMMEEICKERTMTSSYSPGDCAHATGHALMVLAEYDPQQAVAYCDGFSTPHMRYYCATGASMEYVTERDKEDAAAGKRTLYPCDAIKYPAACMRYKMVHVIPRLIKKKSDIVRMQKACRALQDPYRLGCFHGVGNGFMGPIATKKVALAAVCAGGDDERLVCIEGAMERMAKYHPQRAEEVCETLEEGTTDRETCNASVRRGMYDMKKDLRFYLE